MNFSQLHAQLNQCSLPRALALAQTRVQLKASQTAILPDSLLLHHGLNLGFSQTFPSLLEGFPNTVCGFEFDDHHAPSPEPASLAAQLNRLPFLRAGLPPLGVRESLIRP